MNTVKSKCLIFSHGWGGTVNFWNNLKPYFGNELINQQLNISKIFFLDLGYFASSIMHNNYIIDDLKNNLIINYDFNLFKINFNNLLNISDVELFVIGHSLGLMKLLKLNLPLKGFIGIQSFSNFLGKDKQLRKTRNIELLKLIKNFTQKPIETLKNFYQFIEPKLEFKLKYKHLNYDKLLNDLYLLTDLDVDLNLDLKINNVKGLIIGATNDMIVPQELIIDNFNNYKNIKINMLPTGEHGLGYKQANIIYQQIIDFIQN